MSVGLIVVQGQGQVRRYIPICLLAGFGSRCVLPVRVCMAC